MRAKLLVIKIFIILFLFNGQKSFGSNLPVVSSGVTGRWFQSQDAPRGWRQSQWLGYFYATPSNWIYHDGLGWLFIGEDSGQSVWIYGEHLGWIWTSPDLYPHLWPNKGKEWVYYDSQRRGLYSYNRNEFPECSTGTKTMPASLVIGSWNFTANSACVFYTSSEVILKLAEQ